MTKKILLTGDRPTGPLHIGHYFGSLINRKKYEKDYHTFIMTADVQALTDNWDNPGKVRDNIFQTVCDNLAMGLDIGESASEEDKTTVFIQSQIPQIAELTVFFSNLITINKLLRNPTIKTEIAQKAEKFGQGGESVTFGFVGYPVSQAADILFLGAEFVPVGEDQMPVIENCRYIAQKFNSLYCPENPIFKIPEGKLSEASRVLGLDGGAKMSKSLNNAIYLKDTPEETITKIKTAKTDSFTEIVYDPENRPEIANLLKIFCLVNEIEIDEALGELKGVGYGAFKQKLGTDMNNYFKDFRERRTYLENHPEIVWNSLKIGRQRALKRAEDMMAKVRKAMQLIDF